MTKRNVRLFITLAVTLLLCLGALAGCGKENVAKNTYTITVMSEGGKTLSDIKVYVYKVAEYETDAGNTNADQPGERALVWAAETDDEGKVTFDAEESDAYVAVLEGVPEGYAAEDSYSIREIQTEIKLTITLTDESGSKDVIYELGVVVNDFEITATNGITYKLSELLDTKKAVVLNFWFLNCAPCKMEFPYLQKAYEQYQDSIEVIAINPVDGTNDKLIAYAQENSLAFPMAVGETSWNNAFELTAFPTTVVIDRYGTVAMKHMGSITEEGVFEKVFAYFSSETYKQTTIRNISEIE